MPSCCPVAASQSARPQTPQWSALSDSAEWWHNGLSVLVSSCLRQRETSIKAWTRGELVLVNIWCLFPQGRVLVCSSKSLPRTAWCRVCAWQQLRGRARPVEPTWSPRAKGTVARTPSLCPHPTRLYSALPVVRALEEEIVRRWYMPDGYKDCRSRLEVGITWTKSPELQEMMTIRDE